MKRLIGVLFGIISLLLSSAGCGVIETRPPCAKVEVANLTSTQKDNDGSDKQADELRKVTITFSAEFGRAYAYARDGEKGVGLGSSKDNPVVLTLPKGDYTLYFSSKKAVKCNAQVRI